MDEAKAERGIRLIEQLEGQHEFEAGLIDPVDWEQFTAWELLRVANGEITIQDLVWDGGRDTPEEVERTERQRLEEWNRQAAS